MGRERFEEQSQVLDEMIRIAETEQVELILVVGDIFDTYTPSAEAVELFFSKIKLLAGKERAVLLISGNHDDGFRLSAVSPLSEEQGIYVVGNDRKPLPIGGTRNVRVARSGKGYAVFENTSGERIFVSTLPYPNEARFKEEKSELGYVEQMQKWIAEGEIGNTDHDPSVFMAHLFVAGGAVSDSEREIDLGGARAVPVSALPKSDYIALGHLHKKQRMGNHCYYSGSPLQYSFDERPDKSVKIFDLTKNGVENLTDIPLQSGKKLVRLQAESISAAESLLAAYANELVELKLLLNAPLASADAKSLAERGNLVSLLTEIQSEETMQIESRKGLSGEQLFETFYKTQYDSEPKTELKELFLSLLSETEHE